jgi:hypothetical protein
VEKRFGPLRGNLLLHNLPRFICQAFSQLLREVRGLAIPGAQSLSPALGFEVDEPAVPYSCLSADTGSTLIARSAGM